MTKKSYIKIQRLFRAKNIVKKLINANHLTLWRQKSSCMKEEMKHFEKALSAKRTFRLKTNFFNL